MFRHSFQSIWDEREREREEREERKKKEGGKNEKDIKKRERGKKKRNRLSWSVQPEQVDEFNCVKEKEMVQKEFGEVYASI